MGLLGSNIAQTSFGARGGDILSRFTTIMVGVFLGGSFLLAYLTSRPPNPLGDVSVPPPVTAPAGPETNGGTNAGAGATNAPAPLTP